MVAAPGTAAATATATTATTATTTTTALAATAATPATSTSTPATTALAPATTSTPASPAQAGTVKLRILKAAIVNGPRDFASKVATLTKWAQEKRPLRGHIFSPQEVEEAALEVQAELIAKAVKQGAEAAARAAARAAACAAAAAEAKRKKDEEEAAAAAAGQAAAAAAAAEEAAAEAAAKAAETAELAPGAASTPAPGTATAGTGTAGAGVGGGAGAGTVVGPGAAGAAGQAKADYLVGLPAPLANDWPLPMVSEAAFEVAGTLGDFPLHIRTKLAPEDLLRALWRLLREHDETSSEESEVVQVLNCRDGKVFVHQAVLAAASGGQWKEESCQGFDKRVVESAVRFIYLGRVVLEPWLLPQLWELSACFGTLRDNLLTGMTNLSLGSQLQVLAGMDVCKQEEIAFLPAFAAQIRDRLQAATAMVQGPPDSKAATTVWKFVDFVGNWASLPVTKKSSLPQRLKAWLDVPEIGQEHLDRFLVKALEHAPRGQLPMLTHWKPILSTAHIEEIVQGLAVSATDGLADETGNHKTWIGWLTANCWDFGQLWGHYSVLQTAEQGRRSSMTEDLPEAAPTRSAAGALPDDVEWLFEKAFAESVLHDELGANTQQWEAQTFRNNGFSPWRSCLGLLQSWHRVANACRASGSLPPGLSATALAILLPVITYKMPPTVVRLTSSTCPGVNGTYKRIQRGNSEEVSFLRISPYSTPQLILRRKPLDKSIFVAWDGLPIRKIEEAKCFWSIMRITDDQETDEPQAIGVHHTTDPTEVHFWWTPAAGGRFASDRAFSALPEDIAEEHSKPILEAIAKWSASKNGLIAQLKQEVSRPVGQGRIPDLRPIICQDYLARTLVSAALKKMCAKFDIKTEATQEAVQLGSQDVKRPLQDGEGGPEPEQKRAKIESP